MRLQWCTQLSDFRSPPPLGLLMSSRCPSWATSLRHFFVMRMVNVAIWPRGTACLSFCVEPALGKFGNRIPEYLCRILTSFQTRCTLTSAIVSVGRVQAERTCDASECSKFIFRLRDECSSWTTGLAGADLQGLCSCSTKPRKPIINEHPSVACFLSLERASSGVLLP